MKKLYIVAFIGIIILGGCEKTDTPNQTDREVNPAAEGFNTEASDSAAIAIADSVMKAMGGRTNWDETKIIHWNFFGRRTHTWNKQTGRDSINIPNQDMTIDMNINSKEGAVFKNGTKLSQPDSVEKYMNKGYEMWVNDSYWLLMPFKLKDSGVTLTYEGEDTTAAGERAYKLKLVFDSVGVTPQNMFYVYVDTSNYMVRQWAYFESADMDEPGFVLPWKDYEKHGQIMLSGNRGKSQISDIAVMDSWPGAPLY